MPTTRMSHMYARIIPRFGCPDALRLQDVLDRLRPPAHEADPVRRSLRWPGVDDLHVLELGPAGKTSDTRTQAYASINRQDKTGQGRKHKQTGKTGQGTQASHRSRGRGGVG